MDFDYSPQEELFRQELRAWLETNLPEEYNPETFETLDEDARFKIRLKWQKKLHAAGLVGVHWPKEYGGRGATVVEQAIYQQEMARVRAPGVANPLGISIVGPTLMHWGTEEQKKRYVPKILSAEEIWCQGYSEPGSGSDFASLQTRAVEDGDYFVINGQKVWTSYAHQAHRCILVARTDPDAPKHKGLSYLLVDMKSPGVTVRPLVQITGDSEFNEVFFEDVLKVDGFIKGHVRSAYGTLLMTENGRIEADVDVRVAIIDGHLEGTLRATEHVVLNSTARVAGDIHTPSLSIKDGAVFEGNSYFLERRVYSEICQVETESDAQLAMVAGV